MKTMFGGDCAEAGSASASTSNVARDIGGTPTREGCPKPTPVRGWAFRGLALLFRSWGGGFAPHREPEARRTCLELRQRRAGGANECRVLRPPDDVERPGAAGLVGGQAQCDRLRLALRRGNDF